MRVGATPPPATPPTGKGDSIHAHMGDTVGADDDAVGFEFNPCA